MTDSIDTLTARLKSLEAELEAQYAIARAGLTYRIEEGRIRFEQEILKAHRALKKNVARYVLGAQVMNIVVAPVIYSLIIPFALIDLFVTLYQWICFPVYGIEKVRRSDYLIFDRAHLAYLNIVEKINCAYCSYCNGVAGYVREIGARTEQHWCPIKHARRVVAAHPRYNSFAEFGDAEAFHKTPESGA